MQRILVVQNFKANGFKGAIGQELSASDLAKIGEEVFHRLVSEEVILVDAAAPLMGQDDDADSESPAVDELPEDNAKPKGKKKKG